MGHVYFECSATRISSHGDCGPAIIGGALMDICKQLDKIDPTPTYSGDTEEWPHIVIPRETVGCAFGSRVELPEIPLNEAVKVCQRISKRIEKIK